MLQLLVLRSVAQQNSISIVGGVFQTSYAFEKSTLYPNTAIVFPWQGEYSKANMLLGADVSRSLSDHWSIKTGLRLLLTGYSQEVDLMWGSEFTPNGYERLLPNERLVINHLFLEIPLAVRYIILRKKITPFAEAGITSNYYLKTRVKQRIEGHYKKYWDSSEDVHGLNLALKAGAGLCYRITEKQRLFVLPLIRYQLTNIEQMSSNFGIGFGLEASWQFHLGI